MATQDDHQRKTSGGLVASEIATVERMGALRPWEDFAGEDEESPPTDYGSISEDDATAILDFEAAFDPQNATQSLPTDLYDDGRKIKFKEPGTRATWIQRLHYTARELTLTDATADDINGFTTGKVKSGDWQEQSAKAYGQTLKKFYRYHSGLDVDPKDITLHEGDGPSWDDRDILDTEERFKLTAEAPDHPRDAAIVNLLLYTGMRNTALRMCRVRDIDLETGEYYFNNTADGLKDLHKPRQPRPLLWAEDAVRDWIQYHPTAEDGEADPNAYLITGKPKWQKANPYEPVSAKTIQRTMRKLTEKAFGVDKSSDFPKPTHPHMMRHNYVTWLKRDLERPDDEIKFLIAHAPDSTVMQTTYSHLSSADYGANVREAAGMGDEEDGEKRIAPEVCKCGAPQERPQAVSCWKCGLNFSPAAWKTQKDAEADAERAIPQIENETEARIVSQVLAEIRENPDELLDE